METTFTPYTMNLLINALQAHAAADVYLPIGIKMHCESFKKARSLTATALEQLERDLKS